MSKNKGLRNSPRRKTDDELSLYTKKDRGIPLSPTEEEEWKKWCRDWSKRSHTTIRGRAGVLCRSAKRTAKLCGLEFNLTPTWIREKLEKGHCEVTGLPFDLTNRNMGVKGPGNIQKYAPSLDRKDRTKGYTMENVQLVVWMYNVGKSTYTHEELIEFAHILLAAEQRRLQSEECAKSLSGL
jgi:hypothetical protein